MALAYVVLKMGGQLRAELDRAALVQAVTSWIPTEFWVIVGLSIGSLVVLGIVSWLKG